MATVSRALRGLPNVAGSTRSRVAAAAERLAYRPDPAAAKLATGRSRSIAVAVPHLNGWYFSNVVAGVEAVCSEADYDMIVIGVKDHADRRNLLDVSTSIHRRVDGLVFVDIPLDPGDIETLARHRLRVATVGQSTQHFPSVGIDDVMVGDLATSHLIELGHQRIALIGGEPEYSLGLDVPGLRRSGYEDAIARGGLAVDPALVVPGSFSVVGGRDAMATLLQQPEPPTAVFTMSDEMAFGVLWTLRAAGLQGGEVAVVGVDDHELAVVVGLTTVRQDVADHGARAARLVIDQLDGVDVSGRPRTGDVELIVRETSSKP